MKTMSILFSNIVCFVFMCVIFFLWNVEIILLILDLFL